MDLQLKGRFFHILKYRKQDIIIIFFAVTLLTIVIFITTILLKKEGPPNSQQNHVKSSPTPFVTPSIAYNAPIFYNSDAGSQLADKIINKQPLSQNDIEAKEALLSTILHGHNSGIVYESTIVRVEYVESADIFMAEILTPDIFGAKSQTNTWFKNEGLSQKAICDLPIMFYINSDAAEQLRGHNVQFSPIPIGC